jgi:hypothetical protein
MLNICLNICFVFGFGLGTNRVANVRETGATYQGAIYQIAPTSADGCSSARLKCVIVYG